MTYIVVHQMIAEQKLVVRSVAKCA